MEQFWTSKSLYTILKKVLYLMSTRIFLQLQARKEFLRNSCKRLNLMKARKLMFIPMMGTILLLTQHNYWIIKIEWCTHWGVGVFIKRLFVTLYHFQNGNRFCSRYLGCVDRTRILIMERLCIIWKIQYSWNYSITLDTDMILNNSKTTKNGYKNNYK